MADDCCTLLLLHAAERRLTATKAPLNSVTRLLHPGVLRGPHWLAAYEASSKGWLPTSTPNYIRNDRVFAFLRDNGVEFYDRSEPIEREEESDKEEAVG